MIIRAYAKWYDPFKSFAAFKNSVDTVPILNYRNLVYCPCKEFCGEEHKDHSIKTFKKGTRQEDKEVILECFVEI